MTEHDNHAMHENSLTAYRAEAKDLGGRNLEIYSFMLRQRAPMTDREIARVLGYSHRSAVQPRISDLVTSGWLVEVDTVVETDSGRARHVRRVKAVNHAEREQLQLQLQMV